VGFTTDALATYRFAVRPTLDLDNPVNWTRAHLSEELGRAEVPIVLSHAGLRADREILPLVPRGTLFIGGHDHIRLVHATDTATYVHTGSWLQSVTVAELRFREGTPQWTVDQTNLTDVQPQDAAFTAMVRTTITAALTADDQRIVGRTREAMTAAAAARFAVESARRAANADLAIVGATTFGDGLPRGDVTAYAFDNCVRFDGPLYVATLSGKAARALLRRCNQDPNTPFDERTGENLIASARGDLDDASTYRIVTTDWIGRNPAALLGKDAPKFTEVPELTLKRSVTDALK
jgi:2',3'-cyclic-nucleotide 2'-phosphodiesterase (5'-nucleotidase family)